MGDMWRYWKEKYCSRVGALENQYPQTLRSHEELRMQVAAIKAAEARIDQIMEALQEEGEKDE